MTVEDEARARIVAALTTRLAGVRRAVDAGIDSFRYRIDTFPWTYHPTPVGSTCARRGTGTTTRWLAIERLVDELRFLTAVDVGCNGGYFVLQLADRGLLVTGVDEDRRFCRVLQYEARRRNLNNVGVLALRVEPSTVEAVPSADCVLFLSVWHHLVREHGIEDADEVLSRLWVRARKALVFDTGETEMPTSFGLPEMGPDARTWLEAHLERICDGGLVRHLGKHQAFAPDGTLSNRNLFAVVRGAEVQGAEVGPDASP